MNNPELEARIRESGAVEDYAVYGDWLEERGDPRGKLIALQIAGVPWAEYVEEHDELFGVPPRVEVSWKYGFWHTLDTRGQAIDLAAALARPSARLLEALVLAYEGTSPRHFRATLTRSSRVAGASTLEALGRLLRYDHDPDGWQPALVEIRRLGLGCTDLVRLDGSLDESQGATIAKLDGLQRLTLEPHMGAPLTISREALLALAPLAGSLVSLSANLCWHMDDACLEMLSTFEHLEELFVRETSITAAGMQRLATLPKLRYLDVGSCRHADDEMADVIGTFPAIKTVAIDRTAITGWGVKGIGRSKTIDKLILDYGQYPDEIESVLGIELDSRPG